MDIAGFDLPLWLVFLGVVFLVIVAWKLIKFAIKVLIALLVLFLLLTGLDYLGFFNLLTNLFHLS